MGRKREEKWGSRIIDIDILFYNDEIINEPNLTIPHPELHNRRFTLEPLADDSARFIHPVLEIRTYLELKNELKTA
jgi:2-amino-4-hydroxy-6-hydroxymethyldihydropteridine diphosphokinase